MEYAGDDTDRAWLVLQRNATRDYLAVCCELSLAMMDLVTAHPTYGTSRLWSSWIARIRRESAPAA